MPGLLGTTRRDWSEEREWELALLATVRGVRVEKITPLIAFRAARRSSGLSIEAFAQRLGLYPGAVLVWERGRKPIPAWVLRRGPRYLAGRGGLEIEAAAPGAASRRGGGGAAAPGGHVKEDGPCRRRTSARSHR